MKSLVFLFMTILLILPLPASAVVTELPTAGALSGWAPTGISFDFGITGRPFAGSIFYAVYNASGYPGSAPSGGSYIYAYQIFNNSSSTAAIDSLSIGILGDAKAGKIKCDDFQSPNGIDASLSYFSPNAAAAQSAKFLFLSSPNGLVESGQHSVLLLFSSDDSPTHGFGVIEGGGVGGRVDGLATPLATPEPTTMTLLGAAGILSLIRKKRSARKDSGNTE
jgi:hypothetical protein